eukprot:scaffold88364_cov72-Phaeocystis_antarctica.AAC.1
MALLTMALLTMALLTMALLTMAGPRCGRSARRTCRGGAAALRLPRPPLSTRALALHRSHQDGQPARRQRGRAPGILTMALLTVATLTMGLLTVALLTRRRPP